MNNCVDLDFLGGNQACMCGNSSFAWIIDITERRWFTAGMINTFLSFWPEEDSVSVVSWNSIVDANTFEDGTTCQIKLRSKLYSGKIAASGK